MGGFDVWGAVAGATGAANAYNAQRQTNAELAWKRYFNNLAYEQQRALARESQQAAVERLLKEWEARQQVAEAANAERLQAAQAKAEAAALEKERQDLNRDINMANQLTEEQLNAPGPDGKSVLDRLVVRYEKFYPGQGYLLRGILGKAATRKVSGQAGGKATGQQNYGTFLQSLGSEGYVPPTIGFREVQGPEDVQANLGSVMDVVGALINPVGTAMQAQRAMAEGAVAPGNLPATTSPWVARPKTPNELGRYEGIEGRALLLGAKPNEAMTRAQMAMNADEARARNIAAAERAGQQLGISKRYLELAENRAAREAAGIAKGKPLEDMNQQQQQAFLAKHGLEGISSWADKGPMYLMSAWIALGARPWAAWNTLSNMPIPQGWINETQRLAQAGTSAALRKFTGGERRKLTSAELRKKWNEDCEKAYKAKVARQAQSSDGGPL